MLSDTLDVALDEAMAETSDKCVVQGVFLENEDVMRDTFEIPMLTGNRSIYT